MMSIEIERKFLVKEESWRASADAGCLYRQGYLHADPERTVRIRLAGEQAFLTIKGKRTGFSCPEFEYSIPPADAEKLLLLCGKKVLEKTRYRLEWKGLLWEVDCFHGRHEGLVLAEVELTEENQKIRLPPWVGKEVSLDPAYTNAHLAFREI